MADPEREASGRGPEDDELTTAYAVRTQQLYEARGALADAVAEMSMELHHRRAEAEQLSKRAAELENELRHTVQILDELRNMKVVRWTAWPRRLVYGLRSRRR